MGNFNYKCKHIICKETLEPNDVKVFTYEDYIYYKGKLCQGVEEPDVKYEQKKLGQESLQNLINKLKERGNGMSALEEYLESLIDQGLEQGINKNKREIVKRMLQNNMDENTIKLMTQETQEELEEIKKGKQYV